MPDQLRVRASGVLLRDHCILLVKYDHPVLGFHYNLPGGGVRADESLRAAVQREWHEETLLRVTVGDLLLTWEFLPDLPPERRAALHAVGFVFRVQVPEGAQPRLPLVPDPDQSGFDWVAVDDLRNVPLLPHIAADLQAVLRGDTTPGVHCLDRVYVGGG